MQAEYKNKQMEPGKTKAAASVPGEPKEEQYFFPGGMEYRPMTVMAKSQEEAARIWEKQRKSN